MDQYSTDALARAIHKLYLDAAQSGPLPEAPDNRLSQSVSDLLRRSQDYSGKPEMREVSILLSDLRGFTALSEHFSPLEIIDLLNRYLKAMTEVIGQFDGVIDKFMGDGIMVVFGAPESKPDDLERALNCAIEMQIRLDQMNTENRELGYPPLYMGIGINTGQVVAGKVGSDLYNEYTVIGDHVNLASRVESFSLRGQVLISEHSYQRCADFVETGRTNTLSMKGKQHPVKLYEVRAVSRPTHRTLPKSDIRKSPRIEVNMPISFFLVEGKSVSSAPRDGIIIDLGYGGMYIASDTEMPPMTEICFPLSLSLSANQQSDVYARVIRINPMNDTFHYHLEFSSISDDAETAVRAFINRIIEPN